MKLKFKHQDYQWAATAAAVDLFIGQEKMESTFSITYGNQRSFIENLGFQNVLRLDDEAILKNMHAVQRRFNLPLTYDIQDKRFNINMETGTGKTYVYTQTILELHRKYGFTKFIIVVPSVAIREGVYKSLEVTKEHFSVLYDNVPYRYFIYNSSKLSDVRQFATSANVEIMIINIDAFRKSENLIHQETDKLSGAVPIELIQGTNPIVIVDEPQSVDNTVKAKEAMESLHPLFSLRYSATHREEINTIYCLTPVDAYQMGLVKQICVSSVSVENDFNKPYVKLLGVSQDNGFRAKIEIDAQDKKGKVSRKIFTVAPNTDLFLLSGMRELYDGYIISGIDCTPGYEHIEFSNTEEVRLGKAIGDVDENLLKREQIYKTIETHLNKELLLNSKGIKVLSLFFIDKVEKYRTSDGSMGTYARMFEECYRELINHPKYAELKAKYSDCHAAHNGYFSQDKKGTYKDTKGDTIADYDTYNTIMKDKEWLLSFDCPLRFIWSHSALKEGWDNPNVFQVCTLIDQKSTFTCRQKIGRGLRLCVNQDGERIEDRDVNLLHVIANESFAEFADTLQKEIEDVTGMKFGTVDIALLSGLIYEEKRIVEKKVSPTQAQKIVDYFETQGYIDDNGKMTESLKQAAAEKTVELPPELEPVKEQIIEVVTKSEDAIMEASKMTDLSYTEVVTEEKKIEYEDAKEIIEHFNKKDYLQKSGKMKDTMKNALITGTLDLPAKYEAARARLESVIRTTTKKLPVRNAKYDVVVKQKKEVMVSPQFLELWDKIKHKTTYRVQVNTAKLIEQCVEDFRNSPTIPKMRLVSQTAKIDMEQIGVTHEEEEFRTKEIRDDTFPIPNVVAIVSEQTLANRRVVYEIIEKSGRGREMIRNPQMFIEQLTDVINRNCSRMDIDGIRYERLAGEDYYIQEIFDSTELMANLEKNAVEVTKGVYNYVLYDSSTVERPFAVALDNDPDVKLFFKIPRRFKIETPVGAYSPDWAVYLTKDDEEKLYFVLETKGSDDPRDFRDFEALKLYCGKRHFETLADGITLKEGRSWNRIKGDILAETTE